MSRIGIVRHTHITEDFLTENDVPPDVECFLIRNKLIGFPLKLLDDIDGIYHSNDIECVAMRWCSHSGRIVSRDYDEHGNCTRTLFKGGYYWLREYDENGYCTRDETSHGVISTYEYDDHGNMVMSKDSRYEANLKPTTLYENGQLATFGKLKIPQF